MIWIAVSSEKQAEKVSPEVQAELCRQHVTRWGGAVVDELSVSESRDIVLLSDAAAAIPAYARLHDYIKRRAFDVLICYDLSRLGRSTPLILSIVELCARNGILTYEIENPPLSLDGRRSYDENLVRALKAVGYQHEVEKLRSRMRYGREGRARSGKLPQVPPFGYTWRYGANGERSVEVDEEKAPVVRRIVAAYLNGRGQIGIAADLTAAGIPTPSGGATWKKNSVRVILDRVWTYAGFGEYYRGQNERYIRAPGDWTPLITAEQAEQVTREMEVRRKNRRVADTQSRLTGIVICADCNKPMWQVIGHADARETKRYRVASGEVRQLHVQRRARFYCYPHHRGGNIGLDRVMAALSIAIDELAASDLSAIPDEADDRAARIAAQLAEHDAAIARHYAALRRADTAFVSGVMDEERYRDQVRRLKAAIEAEQAAQGALQAAAAAARTSGSRADRLREIAAHGRRMLGTHDTAAANTWFRKFVRVFVRSNNVIEVRFL